MSIVRVVTARAVPHKLDAFIAGLGEVKKILEGHGTRVNFYRSVAGGTPNTILIVSEVDDWASFGEVAAKVGADPGFQDIQRRNADDPFAEILSNDIIEQFELP